MHHALAHELPDPGQILHNRLQALGYSTGFTSKWQVTTEHGPRDYGFQGMNILGYGDIQAYHGIQRYLTENGLKHYPIQI